MHLCLLFKKGISGFHKDFAFRRQNQKEKKSNYIEDLL